VLIRPLFDEVTSTLGRERVLARLSELLALSAAVLAAVGIYGIIAYHVSTRRREIGIRLAIGSAPAQVACLVARRAAAILVAGVAGGWMLSASMLPFVSSLTYGLGPSDRWLPLWCAAAMTLVVVLATAEPLWRALRVEPAAALRVD
jgi:ABC-type antimicrobial peptide transport system permease subunit